MKKRFIHPKTVFRTILAVVLSACLVCSVPMVTADALTPPSSFDAFRRSVLDNANQAYMLYMQDYNNMPYKTILAHNSNSSDIAQWQSQYFDTSSTRIALTEGYLFDLCQRAYPAATADPFILKCIQARQACWLETIAQMENSTSAACAVINIAAMSDPEFETFRNDVMLCNGLPEQARSHIMDFRTLNATVEEFLFAVAATDELYEMMAKIGQLIHRAGSTTQDNDYEVAAMRIEQYTEYTMGTINYVPTLNNILTDPNFDPSACGEAIVDQLWGLICADLNAAQINTAPNIRGMYRLTAVSNDPLLDGYNELNVLADFNNALKPVTEGEVNAPSTPPVDSLAYPAYKVLFASGALTGEMTADFAVNARGSGLFISVVQDDPNKQQEFIDRLHYIASTYSYLSKGLDRSKFNAYLVDECADASSYLNIQPEPPGYETLETTIDPTIATLTTIANTTGDVYITNAPVYFEDYDIFGDLYMQDHLTIYQCNPIVEGSVYQSAGTLEPMDGSLTIGGDYVITGQGVLKLIRPGDYVKVYGKFSTSSTVSHAACLTDGTLFVGGNFAQSGDNGSFQTSGNHRTILFGSATQHVSFDSTQSGFTQLQLDNDDVSFDTALRSLTLCCNLTVRNDWDWQANNLDLNGYTLTELGNFTINDGEIQLNSGTLNVAGDLHVTGTGALPMTNPGDRVNVGGDFVTDTLINHSGRLTHGEMTVKGNFTQMGDPESFAASTDHRVILDGPQPVQNVHFTDPASCFEWLRVMNDYPADYTFTPSPCWHHLEIITTVNEVYLQPRLGNLVPGTYTNLNSGIRGKNLSNPAYTLTLSGNLSQNTYISNDILYVGSDEPTNRVITVTITSIDDPSVTETYQFNSVSTGTLSIGDLNFDGGLSINDATMLQENLAEMFDFLTPQLSLADFNNDGYVNVRDVTAIQRRLAGLE